MVTWGGVNYGGDSSSVQAQLVGVQRLHATQSAFAALRSDGRVVSWGQWDRGGCSDAVRDRLINVEAVFASSAAFAALTKEAELVTWGHVQLGGESSKVAPLRGVCQAGKMSQCGGLNSTPTQCIMQEKLVKVCNRPDYSQSSAARNHST